MFNFLYFKERKLSELENNNSRSIRINKIKAFFLITLFFILPLISAGAPGMHGVKVVSAPNAILNEFTNLSTNTSAGAVSISVASSSLNSNSRFGGNLVAGELIMIIQMRGAIMNTINANSSTWGAIVSYNNSGKFEFVQVSGVPNGTTINLASPLINSYTVSGKVQIIRVPRYSSLTVNSGASITTQPWNGNTGGVLPIEVSGKTIVNGIIDAGGKGFRGGKLKQTSSCCPLGTNNSVYATTNPLTGAEKGEGIAGDTTDYDGEGGRYGRGAPANGGGGGNNHNAGGGGGSNSFNGIPYNGFGIPDTVTDPFWKVAWDLDGALPFFHTNVSSGGGRGGYTYGRRYKDPMIYEPGNSAYTGDNRQNVGGLGGRPLFNSGNRIFMGGGGGAGDSNDGFGSGGGNGGGVIYFIARDSLIGTGSIIANGADALSSYGKDAAGGGGGGGSIVIFSTIITGLADLTLNAKGGKGGDQDCGITGESQGPGGGGGGGYISVSIPNTFVKSTIGGKNGTSSRMPPFLPNGATMGASGNSGIPGNPYTDGTGNLPVTLLSLSAEENENIVRVSWSTASEINNDYFILERSGDGYDFHFLAKIIGAGNSTITQYYQFDDKAPLQNGNYYRLSQVDYDGQSQTYPPVFVWHKQNDLTSFIIDASPNPFSDKIKIDFYLRNESQVELNVINLSGVIVKYETHKASEGINSITIDNMSDFANGIYFLRIKASDKNMMLKLVKY